jgi:hypothetical protein
MMSKPSGLLITFLFLSFFICSCATILKGYYDTVEIRNTPDDLEIISEEGVTIPIKTKQLNVVVPLERKGRRTVFVSRKVQVGEIKLRSNQSHLLTLKTEAETHQVKLYNKIGSGWVFLDIITGIIPGMIDAYTGCWNHFDDIDYAAFQLVTDSTKTE